MRLLGWLFLLFGIAACVVHFMAVDNPVFNWTNNWGEGAAWGIRGGSTLLGLAMAFTGKKKKPK
jgi:hypothetical protein